MWFWLFLEGEAKEKYCFAVKVEERFLNLGVAFRQASAGAGTRVLGHGCSDAGARTWVLGRLEELHPLLVRSALPCQQVHALLV